MSFPYSYSVLGLVPGLILTVVQAAFVLYTSLVVWYAGWNRQSFAHSHIGLGNSVCDIQKLETFATSDKCFFLTRESRGILQRLCSF